VKLSRLAAAGGVEGRVLFAVAWVVSSLRQAGHRSAGVRLSDLAVKDARDPQAAVLRTVGMPVLSCEICAWVETSPRIRRG
jgi:hypothetical protein